MKIISIIGMTFLMSSNTCSSEYINDSRIFVEGKITAGNQNVGNLSVKLVNQDILVSQGETKNDGSFRLGGPGTTNNTSLGLNKKIKSFTASAPDCKLDYDSLSIIIPKSNNYVNFSNITLK